jgi:hypothetical protein
MILPPGITGFRRENELLPTTDFRAFRGRCHKAARSVSGRVVSSAPASNATTSNFAHAVLEMPERTVTVLLNAHFPIIGFAYWPLKSLALRFIDVPALEEAFQATPSIKFSAARN